MLQIHAYSQTRFDLALIKELFREYNAHIGVDLAFQDFEDELGNLPDRYVPEKKGELYLAFWNESPIGCASFYELKPGVAEIKRVFVRPEGQGRGVGKALMRRLLADTPNFGYQQAYLDSLWRLGAARALYEKLGFEEIEPFNENPYDDVYYMAKTL